MDALFNAWCEAAASLRKRLNLKSAIVFGDGISDLDMRKAFLQFRAANKYVDDYMSNEERRCKLLMQSISAGRAASISRSFS